LSEFFGDTWIWNGDTWKKIETVGPSPRAFHAMTFDGQLNKVVLFSGRFGDELLTDTWSWDGNKWKLLSEQGPERRGVYSMVFDHQRNLSLFHGSGIRKNNKWTLYGETWVWNGSKWMEYKTMASRK
jgi:hypothetical protein